MSLIECLTCKPLCELGGEVHMSMSMKNYLLTYLVLSRVNDNFWISKNVRTFQGLVWPWPLTQGHENFSELKILLCAVSLSNLARFGLSSQKLKNIFILGGLNPVFLKLLYLINLHQTFQWIGPGQWVHSKKKSTSNGPQDSYHGPSRYNLVLPGTDTCALFVTNWSTKKGAPNYFLC